ncbi:hypothetical protein EJB05_03118, partial [Eragrostis curvula]
MMMDAEEDGYAEAVPSSSSSTFSSISGSTPTSTSFHQPGEISSLHISPSPIAYDDDHHGLLFDNLDTIVNLDDLMTQEALQEQAQQKKLESHGAFRRYVPQLSPRKKPKPEGCGQRAIKAIMSAMERMHMARLAQWQSYQIAEDSATPVHPQQLQRAAAARLVGAQAPRKAQGRLQGSQDSASPWLQDRASTLMGARDYVNSL